MRFKRLEVTEPSGHKLEFLKDIDTGKLYKRTGLVPRDLEIRGCQIVESYVPDIDKIGYWIDEGLCADGHSEHAYRCSECNEHYIGYVGEFKFCPNCGALEGADV